MGMIPSEWEGMGTIRVIFAHLQFEDKRVDLNDILFLLQGLDNRWLIKMNSEEAASHLVHEGFHL